MKNLLRFASLARPYKARIVAFMGFNLLMAIFNVFSIAIFIPFLKIIFRGEPTDLTPVARPESFNTDQWLNYIDFIQARQIQLWGANDALVYFSVFIVLMFLLKNGFHFLSFFNLAYIRSAVVRDLRFNLYHKLLHLPLSFYGKQKKGDLLSRFSNDVKDVEWSMLGVLELMFKHPFSIIVPLISLFITSWQLTIFVMVVLPISGFIISRLGKNLKDAASKGQEKMSVVMSVLEETLGGVKIIKSFVAEKSITQRFRSLNDDHFKLMVRLHRRELAASPLSEFMSSIVIALILVFGGRLVLNESIALSGEYFIAYVAIFSQLIPPAKALSEGFFRMQKGLASLDRIDSIINDYEAENPGAESAIEFNHSIQFEKVRFGYEKEEVIKGINLEIKKGETIALVGPSGGGKSTIADLVLRFYEPNSGRILIDGKDIDQYSLNSWRNMFGVVTQESVLFNDSVKNNIKLGDKNASDEAVRLASDLANASEFVVDLPKQFETTIGDRGMNLSGGQRQRLAIARAVVQNPPILVLDEATSALDTESEHLVQEALNKVMKSRTSLVIAHRLSTIKSADRILVIEKGTVKESGSHEELMVKNGLYKKLIELQELG